MELEKERKAIIDRVNTVRPKSVTAVFTLDELHEDYRTPIFARDHRALVVHEAAHGIVFCRACVKAVDVPTIHEDMNKLIRGYKLLIEDEQDFINNLPAVNLRVSCMECGFDLIMEQPDVGADQEQSLRQMHEQLQISLRNQSQSHNYQQQLANVGRLGQALSPYPDPIAHPVPKDPAQIQRDKIEDMLRTSGLPLKKISALTKKLRGR